MPEGGGRRWRPYRQFSSPRPQSYSSGELRTGVNRAEGAQNLVLDDRVAQQLGTGMLGVGRDELAQLEVESGNRVSLEDALSRGRYGPHSRNIPPAFG